MEKIKLFVCCHKKSYVPEHPLLAPIQVGTALSQERFKGFLHDDEGDNISEKNREYCELTAHYWAWKNIDADYYGFFHYRRFLYPRCNERVPYTYTGNLTSSGLNSFGFDRFGETIAENDMIVPMAENMHQSVMQHYGNASYHNIGDIKTVQNIVSEMYPDYSDALREYLGSRYHYFGNIFIMRREVFQDYCQWLFSILARYDEAKPSYTGQEARVDGYLAERLLGAYYIKNRKALKTLELPRLFIEEDEKELRTKKMQNFLLPPGTKRRAFVKAVFYKR